MRFRFTVHQSELYLFLNWPIFSSASRSTLDIGALTVNLMPQIRTFVSYLKVAATSASYITLQIRPRSALFPPHVPMINA